LGLLVEEQRTNFATQSETFSGWTVQGLTQSTDAILNPAGSSDAQLFVEDTTTGVHRLFLSPTTGQLAHSFSVWVKPASGTRLFYVESDGPTGTRRNLRFNLQSGTVDLNPGDWSGVFITPYPNGWFRLGGTITDNGSSTLFILGSSNSGAASYTGDGTSGVYIWGAQLEPGAFPTSYIPTTDAAATRAADVASISGSNFSSWYRQDEGTVFTEFRDSPSTQGEYPFAISDNTVSNRFTLFTSGSSSLNSRLISAGSVFNPGNVSFIASSLIRACTAGKTGADQAITACNGVLSNAGSPTSMPAVNRMYIGAAHNGLEQTNGTIRRLTYWPARLPNETLQTITQ
jgi:hypothetical protein